MTTRPDASRDRDEGRGSPLRQQYDGLKAQHPGCLLLVHLGDFFEAFEEDARTLARVCGVTLTSKEFGKGDRVALAGVPTTRLDHYLALLIEAGVHVAVAEQVTPPGAGLVEREITRVVTPGTLAEPGLLRDKENNFLAAVVAGKTGIGLAFVDVTTGELAATQLDGDEAETRLRQELDRLGPAELLLPEGQDLDLPPLGHRTIGEAWRFQEPAARERLCAQFGVVSLEGFGCEQRPLAVRAAGAILSYLDENNRRLLASLAELKTYTTAAGMVLDGHTRRNLELLRNSRSGRVEGSLLGVLDRTRTPMGGRLLRRWLSQPLLDPVEIDARLDAVAELLREDWLRAQARGLLSHVGDLERRLGRIVQGVAVPRELLDLADALRAIGVLRDILVEATDRLVHLDPASLDSCPDVVDLIGRAVAPPGSGRTIAPDYSPELDALIDGISGTRRRIADLERTERERTGIKSLKVGYNQVFGYYLEVTRPNLSHVPAHYHRKQTLVSAERFITPDLKEWESSIAHAQDRIAKLEQEEYAELLRQVGSRAPRLRQLAASLARLDVAAAFAELARDRDYCRPVVDRGDQITIRDARHPVVEASLDPGAFIPNDCALGADDCRIMVLTGPNMAGKSTYLREVALIVLLAQVGSFVPAREARIGLVDRIFTRVGAQDDIASGFSTFMVEMFETAGILRQATPRSLVILDELGRGTSTFDGMAIARAVVEEIHARIGARTLFATHFHELASLADELDAVRVFNVAVAEAGPEIVFLRKVVPGAADRSYGIQVARLAGLPASVTRRAEEILETLERGRNPTSGRSPESRIQNPEMGTAPTPCSLRQVDGSGLRRVNGVGGGEGDGPNPLSPFPAREGGTRAADGTGFAGDEPSRKVPLPEEEGPGEGILALSGLPPGPVQLTLAGLSAAGPAPGSLMSELLSIDLATTTPLDALNKLADLQRRAGRH